MISYDLIALLTLVAMVASAIDAVAGGGGLIVLPALMLAGYPPVNAIATNKLQSIVSSFSSMMTFSRHKLIDWQKGRLIALSAFIGGVGGALSVSLIPENYLKAAVPFLLISIAIYFLFAPQFNDTPRPAKIAFPLFLLLFVPLLAFYDGFFGPGTGSFFIVLFVTLQGLGLLSANAYTKVANLACNLGALTIFLSQGNADYLMAFFMAIGAFIGAILGSQLALKFGSQIIKPLLIVMSTSMALKLFFDPANPLYSIVFSRF